MKPIFADLNNIDADGCIRLNCSGTIADLNEAGIALEVGMLLTVTDGDLIAQVIVSSPSEEGVWRANVVGEIRSV
jgi:hypothetical protein